MPTVLREQGYQFYFYSHETTEPPHVAKNYGFSEVELNRIRDIILEKQSFLTSKWHEYFNRHKNG